MIETFQVDYENFREAIDREIFLDIDLFLTGGTFESSADHSFWLNEFIKTLT